MFKEMAVAVVIVTMASAGSAMARGPDRVGAFEKGGPPGGAPRKQDDKKKSVDKYTCAMKCVESDKAGKCPKCGMQMNKLEKKDEKRAAEKHDDHSEHQH